MGRLLTLLVCATALAATEMKMTVEQVVSFVKSSVKMHYPDKQVAEYLHHVRLTNRLDDRTIEDLQGDGAGPRTVIALNDLRASSASLPVAPRIVKAEPPPPAPGPDSIEQARIIDAARDYARNYSKQLPNFMCLQVTRQYVDWSLGDAPGTETWSGVGMFTSRLSYFDQKEDYKVVMVDNRSVDGLPLQSLQGTVSAGEFGSMMKEIFEKESETRFGWDHWATLRGRRMYVFAYDIDQAHSKYHITWDRTQHVMPAYRGLIYVDTDTNMIMRITQEPYDLPASFPVQAVKETLDYDFQKIGSGEFLVPMKAVISSRTPTFLTKNDIEFRLYQKFGTESTIKFEDTPPPLSDDKVKEKK